MYESAPCIGVVGLYCIEAIKVITYFGVIDNGDEDLKKYGKQAPIRGVRELIIYMFES